MMANPEEGHIMGWVVSAKWEHSRLPGHWSPVESVLKYRGGRWLAGVTSQGESLIPGKEQADRDGFGLRLAQDVPEIKKAILTSLQAFHNLPLGGGDLVRVQEAWGLQVSLGRELPELLDRVKVEWAQFQCGVEWTRQGRPGDSGGPLLAVREARLSVHLEGTRGWQGSVHQVTTKEPAPRHPPRNPLLLDNAADQTKAVPDEEVSPAAAGEGFPVAVVGKRLISQSGPHLRQAGNATDSGMNRAVLAALGERNGYLSNGLLPIKELRIETTRDATWGGGGGPSLAGGVNPRCDGARHEEWIWQGSFQHPMCPPLWIDCELAVTTGANPEAWRASVRNQHFSMGDQEVLKSLQKDASLLASLTDALQRCNGLGVVTLTLARLTALQEVAVEVEVGPTGGEGTQWLGCRATVECGHARDAYVTKQQASRTRRSSLVAGLLTGEVAPALMIHICTASVRIIRAGKHGWSVVVEGMALQPGLFGPTKVPVEVAERLRRDALAREGVRDRIGERNQHARCRLGWAS